MITFQRLGGWGLWNSLFQIATTVAIARDNQTDYAFPHDCNFRRQRFHGSSMFKHELPWTIQDLSKFKHWGTGDIRYIQPPKITQDTNIDGFFQSEQYFKHHRSAIQEVLALKPEHESMLRSKYAHLLNDKSCVMSFRRGEDYYRADELKVLDLQFYKGAMSKFSDDTKYVIFSDNLEWCKKHLNFIKNKEFVSAGDNVLDMYLMSYFKNNIIANSTFSWWGAWLGRQDKIVYMPNPSNNWFSDFYYSTRRHHGFQSLACENWIIL